MVVWPLLVTTFDVGRVDYLGLDGSTITVFVFPLGVVIITGDGGSTVVTLGVEITTGVGVTGVGVTGVGVTGVGEAGAVVTGVGVTGTGVEVTGVGVIGVGVSGE